MTDAPLARRLGTADAVWIGLGAMLGAGVFSAFAPAAASAGGTGLLVALAIAGLVAWCNATSSAQLAAQYPTSGGTYVYARERIGAWAGFGAGWAFVVGKTASCAAMALTLAAYVAPAGWERGVGAAAVLGLGAVGYRGATRTATATRVLGVIVLVVLGLVVVAGLAGGVAPSAIGGAPLTGGAPGVLQAAGLLFFAFAGYARVATLGEEVRDPARTIPRAITTALVVVLAVYATVATVALLTLGPGALAVSTAPLADVAAAGGWAWTGPVVRIGAVAACGAALLALLAGISRTALAMAREGDLPRWLTAVHPTHQVPHRAELAVVAVVTVLVLTIDLRGAIGFSSFGVLLYYLLANVSAWTQDGGHRRYPRALQALGAVGCLMLAVMLPIGSVLGGMAVLAVGLGYRALRVRAPG